MFPTTLITGMPPVGGGIRITDQNKGPAVNLVAWITFVVMCLAVLFKIFINLWRNYGNIRLRNLQADDYLITAAMLFALGESIAVSREVPAGIGQHQATLSNYQIISYEKAAYAAEFLYIAALSMARLTVLSLILALASGRTNRTAVVLVGGLTVTWTLSAIFGIAFQCRLPRSWEIISNTCFDQRAFWLGIGIGDVLITLLLIALPIYLLWNLQVPRPKKITIMVAFALRILDIPLIVLRILYIWQADKSADHTFNDYNVVITTQILMNLSIILSCVLFLKPLMNNLQAGWSTSNMRTGLGYNSIIGTGKSNSSYTARSHSYGTKSRSFPMGSVINTGNRNTGIYNKDNNRVCGGLFGGHDPVPTSVTRCEPVAFLDRSSFGSDAMIIKKKVDYTVEGGEHFF